MQSVVFKVPVCYIQVMGITLMLCVVSAVEVGTRDQNEFSRLLEELVRTLRLSETRLQQIPLLMHHLEMALSTRWPGCRTFPFGSTMSGLATKQSDVDCYVDLPRDSSASADVELAKITLEQFPNLFSNFRLALKTLVPVVSFNHIPTGFNVDVSFKSLDGVKNTQLLRYLINLDVRVLQVATVVKHWAKLHKITGKYLLSNYGMVILVIFYMQQRRILPAVDLLQKYAKPYYINNWNMEFNEIAYESHNGESVYHLMGGFFEYYTDFDFNENVISTFVGHPVKREAFETISNVPEEFYLYRQNVGYNITTPLNMSDACIQDPYVHNKNLAMQLDIRPGSRFVVLMQRAAFYYRKKKPKEFLNTILATDTM